jgi:hypothetical protein
MVSPRATATVTVAAAQLIASVIDRTVALTVVWRTRRIISPLSFEDLTGR